MEILFVFLFWSLNIHVQERGVVGVAYYAIQKFSERQCSVALSVFNGVKKPFLSILWGSFGHDNACLLRYLNEFPTGKLQVHLLNDTCHRSPRYCTSWDMPPLKKRLIAVKEFLALNNIQENRVLFSIGLEDQLIFNHAKTRLKLTRKFFPGSILVRNPVHENVGFIGNYYLIERHGMRYLGDSNINIWSNDGEDVCFTNRKRCYRSQIKASYLFGGIKRKRRNHNYIAIWWNTQGVSAGGFIEPYRRNIRIRFKDVREVNSFLRRIKQ